MFFFCNQKKSLYKQLITFFITAFLTFFFISIALLAFFQNGATKRTLQFKTEYIKNTLCSELSTTASLISNNIALISSTPEFYQNMSYNDYRKELFLRDISKQIECISEAISSLWIIYDGETYQYGNSFSTNIDKYKNIYNSLDNENYITHYLGTEKLDSQEYGEDRYNLLFSRTVSLPNSQNCTFVFGLYDEFIQELLSKNYLDFGEELTVHKENLKIASFSNIDESVSNIKYFNFETPLSASEYSLDLSLCYSITIKGFLYNFFITSAPIFLTYIVLIIMLLLICSRIISLITEPLRKFIEKLKSTAYNKYFYSDMAVITDIKYLEHTYDCLAAEIDTLISKTNQMQEEKNTLELNALMRQINPHFINNTLETTRMMCELNDDLLPANMIFKLSNMLKYTFKTDIPISIFRLEISHITDYIEIMKTTSPHEFEFKCHIDEDLDNIAIPRLLLQPLIENCFTHGKIGKTPNGKISLSVNKTHDDRLKIILHDNGNGFKEPITSPNELKHAEKGENMAIYNINRRLQLQFGDNYSFILENNNGAKTVITIPITFET